MYNAADMPEQDRREFLRKSLVTTAGVMGMSATAAWVYHRTRLGRLPRHGNPGRGQGISGRL